MTLQFNQETRTISYENRSVSFNEIEWKWINSQMKIGDMFAVWRLFLKRLKHETH